ncbi:MAG: M23 family metallopeptidase [Spirochaetales bacterium]|nr:M23 family metallopeptidase [Spirochaetales bacterium]
MKKLPSRVFLVLLFTLLLAFSLHGQLDPGGELQYLQGSDGAIYFYAQVQGIIPVYLWVDFPQLQNLEPSSPFPQGWVIPPTLSEQEELQSSLLSLLPEAPPEDLEIPPDGLILFSLRPKANSSTRFQIQFRYTYGIPMDPRSHDHLYLFPFPHGTKFQVTQGFNGSFTHFGENQYALDFDLGVGDPIHAARSGRVIGVKEDSNRGGASSSFASYGNYILVYHDDGSFGNYVHLRQNGALVEVGDWVEAGQLLGYSGNTGQASGPHLHFDVRVPTSDGQFKSIPVRFVSLYGEIIDPEVGKSYYAVHPGGQPFVPVFGDDIRDEDFAGYLEAVPRGDSLEIRTEVVDSTTLVFLQNTYNQAYWVEISLSLTNLLSTQGSRIIREVPAQTEVFLTLLRPANPERGWSHRIQYRFRPLP